MDRQPAHERTSLANESRGKVGEPGGVSPRTDRGLTPPGSPRITHSWPLVAWSIRRENSFQAKRRIPHRHSAGWVLDGRSAVCAAKSNDSAGSPNCGIGSLTEKNGFALGAGPLFHRHIRCGRISCIIAQPDEDSHKPATKTLKPMRRIRESSTPRLVRELLRRCRSGGKLGQRYEPGKMRFLSWPHGGSVSHPTFVNHFFAPELFAFGVP